MFRFLIIVVAFALLAAYAVPKLADQITPVAAEKAQAKAYAPPREIIRANRSGHFLTDVVIDGRTVTMMVDTGATAVVLSHRDAQRVGLSPNRLDYSVRVGTANGAAKVAPIRLQRVSIGRIAVRNVQAFVSQKGALHQSLLGMTFLSQLGAFSVNNGSLVLEE